MAILFDYGTKSICQGLTGPQGAVTGEPAVGLVSTRSHTYPV